LAFENTSIAFCCGLKKESPVALFAARLDFRRRRRQLDEGERQPAGLAHAPMRRTWHMNTLTFERAPSHKSRLRELQIRLPTD
jgi:hypothetical protein